MEIEVLEYTKNPEELLNKIAGVCYGNLSSDNLKRLEYILLHRHFSVLEHASITLLIKNISRVATHQLVRNRIGVSYLQESQRYCNLKSKSFYLPEEIKNNKSALLIYDGVIEHQEKAYNELLDEKIKKEDARMLLPQAIYTNIIVTFNYRSLLTFYEERSCNRAQKEIRMLAENLKEIIENIAPLISEYMRPKCQVYKGILEKCFDDKCIYNISLKDKTT